MVNTFSCTSNFSIVPLNFAANASDRIKCLLQTFFFMLVVLCLTNVLQVFIYAIFQSGNLSKKMLRNKQLNNDRSFQAKIIFQNHRTKILHTFTINESESNHCGIISLSPSGTQYLPARSRRIV